MWSKTGADGEYVECNNHYSLQICDFKKVVIFSLDLFLD